MQPEHRAPVRFALPGICGLVHRGSDTAPLAFAHGVVGQQCSGDTQGGSRLGQAEAVKVFEVHVKPGGSLHLKPLLASSDRATPRDARFGGAAHCPVTGLTYVALGHAVYSIDAGGKGLRWVCGDAGSPGAADGSAHDVRLAFPYHVACPDPGTLVVKDENGTHKVSLIAPGRCGNVQTMSSSGCEDATTFFTAEDAEALVSVWPRPQAVRSSPFPCCSSPSSPPSPPPSSAPLTCYSPTGGGGAAYASLGSITGVAVVPPPPCGRTDNTWPSLDQSGDSAAYDHSDCCNRRQVDLILTDARQDGSFLVHHVTCWRPTNSSAAAAAATQTVRVRTVFDSAQVAAWRVATPAAGAGGVEPEARHSTCSTTTSSCSSARVTTASCGSSGSLSARRSAQYGWVEVEVEPEEAPAAAAARCSPTPAPQSAFAAAAAAAAALPTPPPATAPADPHCPPGGGGVDLSDAPSMDSRELSYSRLPCYSPCCGDNSYGNSGAAVSGWHGAAAASSSGGGDGEFDGVWRCGGVRCPVVLPGGLLLLACPLEGQLLLLHLPQLLEVGEEGEAAQKPKPAAAAAACIVVGKEDCKAPAAVGEETPALPLARRSTSSGSTSSGSNSHDISSTTGDSSADIDNALCLGAAAAAVPGVLLECSSSDISGGDWRNGGGGVSGGGEGGCCMSSGVSNGGAAVCNAAAAGGLLPATPVRYHKRRRWECLVEAVATISNIGDGETRPAAASGGCKRARLESDCYAI
ncbi:hypothetical protein CHLRE_02g105750v5 [Chlamydomonas reinhardtii]|uniref:Uncharacterized protein n=1 Tax=Chlamydomonas reinhardtii TaxID=3055 RepID=A0A2K3E2P3_CHLRE|nr:uncharacterized protein CHLRE_02g105750v5 [Chlamydomonas reinhardtii]PNW87027.1 hypothetical protein CHLRE_02g105750v5 [Chlamydomonas reinhardtii]